MHINVLLQLRERVYRRFEVVASDRRQTFHFALQRFWSYLHHDDLLRGIMQELEASSLDAEDKARAILQKNVFYAQSEKDEVAVAYWLLKLCVERSDSDLEYRIGKLYLPVEGNPDRYYEIFTQLFLKPVYHYIDERLDAQKAVLGLLRRYKHHCEWFRRNDLSSIFADEKARSSEPGKKSRGEKRLALHLYEFLHSQGLSFSIEPASISGEADLVSSQDSDDPLIADVKVFDPQSGKNKAYLISGFHQVYQYTLDYNESFGYLVIFKTCEEGLAFSSRQQEQSTSFVTLNGKTIFFVVIDLFAHEKSASKRGKLKSYVLTEQELVTQQVDTEMPQATPASDDIEQTAGDGGKQ